MKFFNFTLIISMVAEIILVSLESKYYIDLSVYKCLISIVFVVAMCMTQLFEKQEAEKVKKFFKQTTIGSIFLPGVIVSLPKSLCEDFTGLIKLNILYFCIGCLMWCLLSHQLDKREDEKVAKRQKQLEAKIPIPKDAQVVKYKGSAKDFPGEFWQINEYLTESVISLHYCLTEENRRVYLEQYKLTAWMEDKSLSFLLKPDLRWAKIAWKSKISLEDIKCFYQQGSVDNRLTYLVVTDSKTAKDYFLAFDTAAYEAFLKIIPEKEKKLYGV